jgi:hypothetical protein
MTVMGLIEGWGVVVETDRGFRSEYARIKELLYDDEMSWDCGNGLWWRDDDVQWFETAEGQRTIHRAHEAAMARLRIVADNFMAPIVRYREDRMLSHPAVREVMYEPRPGKAGPLPSLEGR